MLHSVTTNTEWHVTLCPVTGNIRKHTHNYNNLGAKKIHFKIKSNTRFSHIKVIHFCLHKNWCWSRYGFLETFVSGSIISSSQRFWQCCSDVCCRDAGKPVSCCAARYLSGCKTRQEIRKCRFCSDVAGGDEYCSLRLYTSTPCRTWLGRHIQVKPTRACLLSSFPAWQQLHLWSHDIFAPFRAGRSTALKYLELAYQRNIAASWCQGSFMALCEWSNTWTCSLPLLHVVWAGKSVCVWDRGFWDDLGKGHSKAGRKAIHKKLLLQPNVFKLPC